ncbi:MAG: aminotransferase class III-fold pyridoxal phosphate-dependent enzyme [bacterium]|nr:aminotransferase class III-fold pyridoxal phosphate-dependent enzyme [bacterium]
MTQTTTHPDLYHLSPVWSHMTDLQPVRGEGIYLYDAHGTRYADFTSGIGVTNTGHCHPRVVGAIQEQAARLLHGQMNIVIPPSVAELARLLDSVTPDGLDCFFFSNSGAEATEAAVKLARQATRRPNLIVFQGSFHGRTAQTMAMTTSKTVYRAFYAPAPAGIFVAPFPYTYEYERLYGWDEETTIAYCLDQLHKLLKAQTAPEETAAIVIEPILGEGGYVPAPIRFLQAVRSLCAEHGILFAADEVQTGFGRTGRMFCYDYADLTPDIMIMAKGLGSGVPISGIGASRALMEQWQTGSHGGTYGGNALTAAAAVATIQVLRDEDLPGNAARMGERLTDGLAELQSRHPMIGNVRGRGLMIGVEFVRQDAGRAVPDKAAAKAVQKACLERNLLLLTCGTNENVIRWIPPLVVSAAQIDDALNVFSDALAAV